jgi:RHS repeat-associated protein
MGSSAPANIVTQTRYNDVGQVIESRQPNDLTGTTAGTTLTSYYTSGSGTCGNVDEAGWICATGPAAQPTSGPPIMTTSFSYNVYGEPLTSTQTNGTTTRTSTATYDSAGRQATEQISVTPTANGGTPVPQTSYGYDPNSGLATTTTSAAIGSTPAITITNGYDTDGRIDSYRDGAGQTTTTAYDASGRPIARDDGEGDITYTYDTSTEHRGLLTSETASDGVGTFSGTYNGNGALATETYPDGIVATHSYDDAGDPVSLSYATGSGTGATTLMSFENTYTGIGQLEEAAGTYTDTQYTYDDASRISTVLDYDSLSSPDDCVSTRDYSYDQDSNRISETYTGLNATTCTTGTNAPITHTYDQADRVDNSGYTYDAFGRTTSVPAADNVAPSTGDGPGALNLTYFSNGAVVHENQDYNSINFTLDPAGRDLTSTSCVDCDGATVTTEYYDNSGDTPSWTYATDDDGDSFTYWSIEGIDGNLAEQTNSTPSDPGYYLWELTDLGDNVVADVPSQYTPTSVGRYTEYTEFGEQRPPCHISYCLYAPFTPNGWLGGHQLSDANLAGTVTMGERLYDTVTGRFLEPDPVPGGSANTYDYTNQDPTNSTDLTGTKPSPVGNGALNQIDAAGSSYDQWILLEMYLASTGNSEYTCWDDGLCVLAVEHPNEVYVTSSGTFTTSPQPGDLTLTQWLTPPKTLGGEASDCGKGSVLGGAVGTVLGPEDIPGIVLGATNGCIGGLIDYYTHSFLGDAYGAFTNIPWQDFVP